METVIALGTVACNEARKFEKYVEKKGIEIYYPIKEMMGDNAAMIAWACIKFFKKERNDLFFKPMPRLGVRSVL